MSSVKCWTTYANFHGCQLLVCLQLMSVKYTVYWLFWVITKNDTRVKFMQQHRWIVLLLCFLSKHTSCWHFYLFIFNSQAGCSPCFQNKANRCLQPYIYCIHHNGIDLLNWTLGKKENMIFFSKCLNYATKGNNDVIMENMMEKGRFNICCFGQIHFWNSVVDKNNLVRMLLIFLPKFSPFFNFLSSDNHASLKLTFSIIDIFNHCPVLYKKHTVFQGVSKYIIIKEVRHKY